MSCFLNYINQYSSAIQAIFTVILVLTTIYYAWQTKKTVKEAENSRKDSRLPIIRVEMQGPIMHYKDKKYIFLSFENIGYGLARNINILFPNKEITALENLNISEKGSIEIDLLSGEDIKINELPEDKKVITIEYDDIFGRKIKTEAKFAHNHRGDWIEFDVIDWQPILPK